MPGQISFAHRVLHEARTHPDDPAGVLERIVEMARSILDLPPEEVAKATWNSMADEINQWDSISGEERDTFVTFTGRLLASGQTIVGDEEGDSASAFAARDMQMDVLSALSDDGSTAESIASLTGHRVEAVSTQIRELEGARLIVKTWKNPTIPTWRRTTLGNSMLAILGNQAGSLATEENPT